MRDVLQQAEKAMEQTARTCLSVVEVLEHERKAWRLRSALRVVAAAAEAARELLAERNTRELVERLIDIAEQSVDES